MWAMARSCVCGAARLRPNAAGGFLSPDATIWTNAEPFKPAPVQVRVLRERVRGTGRQSEVLSGLPARDGCNQQQAQGGKPTEQAPQGASRAISVRASSGRGLSVPSAGFHIGPPRGAFNPMDYSAIIKALRARAEAIDHAITELESLNSADGSTLDPAQPPKRRGRKSMGEAERKEVAERMKRYWAGGGSVRRDEVNPWSETRS